MKIVSNIIRKAYFFKYNVQPFRLSLVSSHVRRRLLSSLGLKKGFRIIDLALTYACNLDCKHCSAELMKSNEKELTIEDYREIVRQSKELDVFSWNITGGEPLLVDWLEYLIPVLKPKTHSIFIQTNCMLLDENKAKKMAELGVNCITTSLDHIQPEKHNEFRGSELSYDKVMEGVRNAKKYGMQALIGVTVSHQNLRSKSLIELIETFNHIGVIVLFNLAIPCGKWAGKSDVMLRGDDREYLLKIMEKYPMTSTDHEVGRNAVGCPAGVEKVYITPYGDVTPCPFLSVSFGNIRSATLSNIVKEMRKVPEFNKYQKFCIGAEDFNFYENVMCKMNSFEPPYPIHYTEIYGDKSKLDE